VNRISPTPRSPNTSDVSDSSPDQPRPRGRPRVEALRGRCLEAAIDVYAELGWSGFNFESVANAAHVGRPALYRRWTDRETLLIDALVHTTPKITDEDLGSLREELKRLLVDYSTVLQGNRGRAGQRLYLDAPAIPDVVATVHGRLMGGRYEVMTAAIRRAARRANAVPAISERIAFGLLLGPALLWNVGDQRPTPLDADAVADSVTALLRLPG
jgi:AcrR family transcriptional regulator